MGLKNSKVQKLNQNIQNSGIKDQSEFRSNKKQSEAVNQLVERYFDKIEGILDIHNNVDIKEAISKQQLYNLIQNICTEIRTMKLIDCSINRDKLFALLQVDFAKLTVLNLRSQGIKILTKMRLVCLTSLTISRCKIGSEGVKNLIKGRWPILTFIFMDQQQEIGGLEVLSYGHWGYIENISHSNSKNKICQMSLTSTCFPKQVQPWLKVYEIHLKLKKMRARLQNRGQNTNNQQ